MNRALILATTLSLAFPLAGMAQPTTQTAGQASSLTRQDLQTLIKNAHSVSDYKQLADYYRRQEAKFRTEASADKVELDRRAQVNASLYQKFPRPVDSAQYFYQSSLSNANDAALQAQHYEQLAAAPQGRS
jgi:hypothetical protein